jgi:hypothetical protein
MIALFLAGLDLTRHPNHDVPLALTGSGHAHFCVSIMSAFRAGRRKCEAMDTTMGIYGGMAELG